MIPKNRNYTGKFIVIYGANNLGKSIQTRLLANRLLEEKHNVLVIKYPIYNLKPTGPRIDKILRDPIYKDRDIKELDLQKLFIKNRHDFQPMVKKLLSLGFSIVAEDYVGTGIAWGVTNTITKDNIPENQKLQLINKFDLLNKGLILPDIAILLDGERFINGKEKNHRNEDRTNYVWNLNREIYQVLKKKYGWKEVQANQTIKRVHNDIWKIISPQVTIQTNFC